MRTSGFRPLNFEIDFRTFFEHVFVVTVAKANATPRACIRAFFTCAHAPAHVSSPLSFIAATRQRVSTSKPGWQVLSRIWSAMFSVRLPLKLVSTHRPMRIPQRTKDCGNLSACVTSVRRSCQSLQLKAFVGTEIVRQRGVRDRLRRTSSLGGVDPAPPATAVAPPRLSFVAKLCQEFDTLCRCHGGVRVEGELSL